MEGKNMKMPEFLKQIGFYLFAKRFVAGETTDDAVKKAHKLQEKGVYAIINVLGEHVKDLERAAQFYSQYFGLLAKLKEEGLQECHISVKPSQLGLDIKEDLFKQYLAGLLEVAKIFLPNAFVEVDREDRSYAETVKRICLDLAKRHKNMRLACQVNFNDTPKEIEELIEAGISVRLCKGTAYPGDTNNEEEIRERYFEQAILLSEKGNRPAIATHDLYLIDRLFGMKNLEFQVLLGIENNGMIQFAQRSKGVGFYIPCGPYWYPYGKRRAKSIPKIFWRNWAYRRRKQLRALF